MLDVEVTTKSLQSQKWELSLGLPFVHCVSLLKQLDSQIKEVQVWYSDQSPLSNDLVLNLAQDGVRLIFDSYSQRLKIIEVYDMNKISLRYCGNTFNSPTVTPSKEQIDQTFGSTYVCAYDSNKQVIVMAFRGLAFTFSTDNQPIYDASTGFQRLQLPPGSMPKLSKMNIYCGPSLGNCEAAPEMPLNCYRGNCILELAEVKRVGATFSSINLKLKAANGGTDAPCSSVHTLQRALTFGLTCQEVASEIGSPNQIFYKADDKMRIHCPDADRSLASRRSDYIYNYFSLGLDLVFDGITHTLKKIILHTNFPGHFNFNIYMRCEFKMILTQELGSEHRMVNPYLCDNVEVTPYTKYVDIEPLVRSSCDRKKPVILQRESSVNNTNPFGPTFCYGYQDMIFEVMRNNHIASVTIYQSAIGS